MPSDQHMPLRWARWAAVVMAVAWPSASHAEGALAVGLPGDVARNGVAFGWAIGFETRAEAEAEALKKCRAFDGAPEATRALCRSFQSFSGQCFAVAMDPKEGTPGVGWAVAPTQAAAERRALEACRSTAGATRRQFCEVSATRCDPR